MKSRNWLLLAAGAILVLASPFAGWEAYPLHQEVISAVPPFVAGVLLIWLALDRRDR